MPAWFDIYSLDKSGQQDEPGILKATESGMIGPDKVDLLFRISCLLDLLRAGGHYSLLITRKHYTHSANLLCYSH